MTARPTLSITIGSTAVPASTLLASLTVTTGRTDLLQNVEPATATLQLLRKQSPPEAAFQLGSSVNIAARANFGVSPLDVVSFFTGRITSITLSEELVTITATSSQLGALAQARGSVTLSAGPVHTAMGAIAAACPVQVDTSLSSSTEIIAQTLTGGTWLDYFRDIGSMDPGSLLYEGTFQYSTNPLGFAPVAKWVSGKARRDMFRPASSAYYFTLNPEAIVDSWEMTKDLGQLVNKCTVSYGSPTATAVHQDSSSISTFGTYETFVSTTLRNLADAELLAQRTVVFGTNPGWTASAITVDLQNWTATNSTFRNLLTNGIGYIAYMPTRPTTRIPEYTIIEGITHRITRTTWFMDFSMSDPELSRLPQRWTDIANSFTPTRRWNQVPAGWDWLDSIKKDL